jgi:hypothetical protein
MWRRFAARRSSGVGTAVAISAFVAMAVAIASSVKKLDGVTDAIAAMSGTIVRGSSVDTVGGSRSRALRTSCWPSSVSARSCRLSAPPSSATTARARRKYHVAVVTIPWAVSSCSCGPTRRDSTRKRRGRQRRSRSVGKVWVGVCHAPEGICEFSAFDRPVRPGGYFGAERREVGSRCRK